MRKKKLDLDCVGFDLDNTLYKTNAEIDNRIREFACREAAKITRRDYEAVREDFENFLQVNQSGSCSLEKIGIVDGKALMQRSLEESDIASLLTRDEELIRMLWSLSGYFSLFLITGSGERAALDKLKALGIDHSLFKPKLYGDSQQYSRRDGSAFHHVAQVYGTQMDRMMFVGDREQADIIPARDLGMTTAIVNARSEHATYQLNEIYELERVLLF